MSDDKRKTEPPLKLDMGFDEAFARFMQTKPEEVDESIGRAKTKRPEHDALLNRPRRPKGVK